MGWASLPIGEHDASRHTIAARDCPECRWKPHPGHPRAESIGGNASERIFGTDEI
ncbi:MAG TPA: hypothetical protein GX715_15955 [Armatimonadetes bacterium]|nr:hypothetical protein [Armatimonadota bacterium]